MSATAVVPAAEVELGRHLPSRRRAVAAAELRERCARERELRYVPLRTDPRIGMRRLARPLTRCERAVDGLLRAALDRSDGLFAPVESIAWRVDFSERAVHYALRGLGPCCPSLDESRCTNPGHMVRGRRTCGPCGEGCGRHLGLWRRVPQFDDVAWSQVTRDCHGRVTPGRTWKRRQVPSCITIGPRAQRTRCRKAAAGVTSRVTPSRSKVTRHASRVTPAPRVSSHGTRVQRLHPYYSPPLRGGGGGRGGCKDPHGKEPPASPAAAPASLSARSLASTPAAATTAGVTRPTERDVVAPDKGAPLLPGGEGAASLAADAALAALDRAGARDARTLADQARFLEEAAQAAQRAHRAKPLEELRAGLDPELDLLAMFPERA